MTRSRTTISGLMVTILLVALLLAPTRDTKFWGIVPYLILASFLSPIVLAPIRVVRRQWSAVDHEYEPVDFRGPGVPEEVSLSFRAIERDLEPLGFILCGSLAASKHVANASGHVALFRNDSTREVARMIGSISTVGALRKVSLVVVIITNFADGTEVLTANNPGPSIFPPLGPPTHAFVFPEVREVERLLGLHRALICRFEDGRVRVDAIGDDAVAFQERTRRRMMDHHLACGYYSLDPDGRVMRPTWKGAILMAWKLSWPAKPIQLARRRRRARKLIRELERAG